MLIHVVDGVTERNSELWELESFIMGIKSASREMEQILSLLCWAANKLPLAPEGYSLYLRTLFTMQTILKRWSRIKAASASACKIGRNMRDPC